MKKYNWNWYKRKIVWGVNVVLALVLRLSGLMRDKTIWVFACWEGKRYDDNSRYLYEYIQDNYKNIRCVWISRNEQVVAKLQSCGKEVYLSNSKEGIRYMLKAGASFYTNGLDDFSDICWVYGSKVICLNHGNTGIKKAAYTLSKFQRDGLKKKFKIFRDKLFNYYYYDRCVTTSEMSSDLFRELYGDEDKRKYIITGMPRNDILVHKDKFVIEKPTFIQDGFRYILYLPTYREYANSVIKDLLEALMNDKEFVKFMRAKKIRFLVKPHNIDTTSEKVTVFNDDFKFVSSDEVESTQVLMCFADCLITDYSSCGTDFALTGKPVWFYVPDFDQYNKDNGFRDLWMDFYNSNQQYRQLKFLKEEIIRYFENGEFDHSANDWINGVYLGKEIEGTIYSENVYRYVANELGM